MYNATCFGGRGLTDSGDKDNYADIGPFLEGEVLGGAVDFELGELSG